MSRDAGRLSLILLLTPFLLWIVLLIVLPQLGMGYLSIREKLGPGEYRLGLGNYADCIG
jgi:spermidine/putrescine transport system permease protein